ncbi:hypothetical protein CW731_06250 [Polaribacter sp. ALD11]|nr:hypothetical protein CW731_06250 [Polaribacter sp. ALD11]
MELKLRNQRYRQETHPPKERAHAERGRLNFEIGGLKNWRFSDPKSKAKRFICYNFFTSVNLLQDKQKFIILICF